ncbi:hypothetical protein Scep_002986 [Stephania cephalantha]|uniref:Uncharacterized protein n=1 Tax=Stephania cephalantha TaxID=152367 RepID=A0AAP0LC15_9MAGN
MQTNSEKQGAEEGVKIRNCPFLSFTDSGAKSLQSLKAAEADSACRSLVPILSSNLISVRSQSYYRDIRPETNGHCLTSWLSGGFIRQKSQPKQLQIMPWMSKSSASSSKSEETIPSWARPDSDEAPPWAREDAKETSPQQTIEVPFYAYLLASTITAIAAIGSIFEFINQKPVFGLLYPDSIFYVPLLGFFVLTGIPTSAFLWFKSVEVANREAEEQDRKDGYL